jgi:hypothetical protein
MKIKIAIAIVTFAISYSDLLFASPYCDVDATLKINDHRWGLWRVVDMPTRNVDNMFEWEDFKTYWFLGFGAYFVIQVSQGTLLALTALLALVFVLYLWKLRRTKTEQVDGEGRS